MNNLIFKLADLILNGLILLLEYLLIFSIFCIIIFILIFYYSVKILTKIKIKLYNYFNKGEVDVFISNKRWKKD